ncbi:MAG TPA: putative sulfate/molybdate transporter [Gemmatimonadaceae bacterium]|nr:putative sulfate/molybdate transporter [Gemmatimonadaceae bacterium]
MTTITAGAAPRFRFDRNELAGAFGDIGTDLPLIAGMVMAAGLDAASVLVMYGLMQYMTAVRYGMPMAVQPLKAMAVLVITQQIAGPVLFGAGLAIGIVMLLLTATGALNWLARIVPKSVVRGLQLGLGLQLVILALGKYVGSEGRVGAGLAMLALALAVALYGNRRFPAALPIIALGIVYAFTFNLDASELVSGFGFTLPMLVAPSARDVWTGLIVLALPQIPLSLGNSLLATRQTAHDLFPEKQVTIRQLGYTYSLMNLVNPWFGGIPTCHGSGGLMGHYTFGARTGGSIIIYGSLFLTMGLFFSDVFSRVVQVFPLPVLGVLLVFEGIALMSLARDIIPAGRELAITLGVAALAVLAPYGYVLGLLLGTLAWYAQAARVGST